MENTNRSKYVPWSLRQYVVYHKYNDSSKAPHSTWAFFGMSQRSESCVNRHFSNASLPSLDPFGLHVRLLGTAIASWRPYLIYINEKIFKLDWRMGGRLFGIECSGLNHIMTLRDTYAGNESTQAYPFSIHHFERKFSEILLCLDSTVDTVTFFAIMYRRMKSKLSSVGMEAGDDIMFSLEDQERDVKYLRKKAEVHLFKARSLREEVGLPLRFAIYCFCC
jgi:hypothetical protein